MRASVVFALAKIYQEGIAQSLVTQEHSLKVCNDFFANLPMLAGLYCCDKMHSKVFSKFAMMSCNLPMLAVVPTVAIKSTKKDFQIDWQCSQ